MIKLIDDDRVVIRSVQVKEGEGRPLTMSFTTSLPRPVTDNGSFYGIAVIGFSVLYY